MNSSEFRTEARGSLQGKWGKAALIVLCYIVVTFLLYKVAGILGEFLSLLVITIVEIPLSFGFSINLFKLFKDENVGVFDFVSNAINNFSRSWSITWRMILKLLLPYIILVVSIVLLGIAAASRNSSLLGILSVIMVVDSIYFTMKSYYYQLAYVVAADNPEMTGLEAVEKSESLMQGRRFKLFCLQLSFIGWIILGIIPFAIGLLWVIPYMQFSVFAFYKNALSENA